VLFGPALAYFIRPAAVKARVMTAPTSSPPPRSAFGFNGGVEGGFAAASGRNTLLRSGTGGEIGEASGISLALGDSAAACDTGLATFSG
jgi:hypothetical protein